MINTNSTIRTQATTRSGRSASESTSAGDTFTSSGTRGLFFGKPVAEAAKAEPAVARTSAQKLQSLGLNAEQATRLADAANENPYFEPYRAGRIDTGEVFLVTQQNWSADPAGFTGYENAFRVYVAAGDEMRELKVTGADRRRDGGSTYIRTDAASFDFPIRGDASVGGRSLTARLDSMQLS
ncbi:MAG: hypothetical protein KF760_12700 [Candidatus Eremiobacteraeota bacterium]|nr:hypothetical protein [Candidatus Eremiobacteraeota bacterium]